MARWIQCPPFWSVRVSLFADKVLAWSLIKVPNENCWDWCFKWSNTGDRTFVFFPNSSYIIYNTIFVICNTIFETSTCSWLVRTRLFSTDDFLDPSWILFSIFNSILRSLIRICKNDGDSTCSDKNSLPSWLLWSVKNL